MIFGTKIFFICPSPTEFACTNKSVKIKYNGENKKISINEAKII